MFCAVFASLYAMDGIQQDKMAAPAVAAPAATAAPAAAAAPVGAAAGAAAGEAAATPVAVPAADAANGRNGVDKEGSARGAARARTHE